MLTAASRSRFTAAKKSGLLWLLGIALATLVAYLPAMRGGWIWDDNKYVTSNLNLHTIHGLRELWLRPGAVPQYYPLTHTTFWIEYHLWGNHPLGYHIDNVLLHAANAVLIGLILCRLGLPGCWLAAAIFALHPIQVESVAWVTERKNVLSGFLYLSALWFGLKLWQITPRVSSTCRVRTADHDPTRCPRSGPYLNSLNKTYTRYLICLSLFILSLLSKSVTASLPAVILLLIWRKRGRITWREIASVIPFFLCGAAAGSMTAWMEKTVVGAAGSDWNFSRPDRLLIAGRAVWFYLAKLAWPHPLVFIYHKWTIDPHAFWQWLFPAGVVGLLTALWFMRHRISRWPLTAALFFVISLFPALGFVNVYPMRYSFVADHFVYLASIAPITAVAALLSRVPRGCATITTFTLLLLVLATLTWRQGCVYADSQTLWTDVVSKDPQSLIGHTNLALAYYTDGDLGRAKAQSQITVQLDQHFVEGWVGLGAIAQDEGNFSQARAYYETARTESPNNPLPYWNLGLLERRMGNIDAAMLEFAQAAQGLPNPSNVYQQLGEIELTRQRYPQAIEQFNRALAADPDLTSAHNDLTAIYLTQGHNDLASAECHAALAINPDDLTASYNMGIVLLRAGQLKNAADYFSRAVQIDPNFSAARESLAKVRRLLPPQ